MNKGIYSFEWMNKSRFIHLNSRSIIQLNKSALFN